MSDETYEPKVYMEQGGDRMVVKSGGEIKLLTGGKLVPDNGTQASAIASVVATDPLAAPAGGTGAAAGGWDTAVNRDLTIDTINANRALAIELSTKLDSVLAALRGAGIIAP